MPSIVYAHAIENPYAKVIEQFIGREFPQGHANGNSKLEAVMAEIIGTKQVRFGPSPSPESLVAMRKVVRFAVENDCTIPILIAAGPKKPGSERLDVAELAMLRTLACLQRRVQEHHPRGLHIRIRFEDATGMILEGPEILEAANGYMADFDRLVRALGYGQWIYCVRETELVEFGRFRQEVESLTALFQRYLEGDRLKLVELEGLGWKGPISVEMQEFLLSRYKKFYPGQSEYAHLRMMAQYFACILARRRLGATGVHNAWVNNGYLQIGFAGPMPDEPAVTTRVYYRTVPFAHSKSHLPPWRAKGYLRMNDEEQPVFALDPFGARKSLDYFPGSLVVHGDNGDNVEVQADCLLDEE